MEIKFDNKGRIVSCSIKEKEKKGKYILNIQEDKLPADFLATFALGKYFVHNGKIVKNKKFRLPKMAELPFSNFLTETQKKPRKSAKPKKPANPKKK
jgi:hypothetical protein